MEADLRRITILEQSRITGQDSYRSICTYGSDKRITVTVTAQAIKDLSEFNCTLEEITLIAVENALERGQTDGEVLVTTESPAIQHLTARFRKIK